jgi:gliding motility-associated-like protein
MEITKTAAYTFIKKLFLLVSITLFAVVNIFAQSPKINSFSPASGPVGTAVVITGAGFNSTAANNIVFFGATRAAVTTASTTSLTVIVPAGATYLPISVLNGGTGLTGYSDQPFVQTFTPNKGAITKADFMPPVTFNTGTSSEFVSVNDLDGDGKPDLILLHVNNNTLSVLRNTSVKGAINANSFAAQVDFATGKAPASMAVGDLDGDGKLDVAVVNSADGTISIFRNTSTIGSISFAPAVTFAERPGTGEVVIGDMDGDGKPDLVVVSSVHIQGQDPSADVYTIAVCRNTSIKGSIAASSFAPGVAIFSSQGGAVKIGDLDGDGKPDIVMDLFYYGEVAIFRNTATAGIINSNSFAAPFYFSTRNNQPEIVFPFSVSIGDIDGDGKPDLVVVNSDSEYMNLGVFRNMSAVGSISFAPQVDFGLGPGYPTFAAIGDLDGDGKPDIALNDLDQDSIAVFRNTSTIGSVTTNSFAAGVKFSDFNPGYGNIVIADLDGDGKPDLVAAIGSSYAGETVAVLQNDPILPLSNIATLNDLTISEGILTPVFASATLNYTDTVSNSVTSVTVTPTVTDTTAKVTVNGVAVTSGTASGAIPLAVGPNTITVVVTAQDGITIDTYTITVYRNAGTGNIYVPNAFTPNGDGKNDMVHVHGETIQSLKFYIYDQWGELLFTSTDPQNGWDGTYKRNKEPAGVYVYYLQAIMADGQKITKKGTITLIR